jgi:hypothetical protein
MEAFRLITESVNHQLVIDLPQSLDGRRFEVIVFPANEQETRPTPLMRRKPSPRLAGTVTLHDDLIAPASPEEDWNALR